MKYFNGLFWRQNAGEGNGMPGLQPDPATEGMTPSTLPVQTGSAAAAPKPTPTAPPVSPTPPALNPDVYCPEDGKRWKEKFYGAQGALKQIRTEATEKVGAAEQQVLSMTEALQQRDATLATLGGQNTELSEQIAAIPELQGQIEQLTQQAARADLYQVLMGYPQLLSMTAQQTVPAETEGGEPTTITVNPVLQLVETSNMSVDQLKVTLDQFLQALPQQTGNNQARSPVTSPATPSPPAPGGPATDDVLLARAKAAQERLNSGDVSPEAMEEHRAAWAALREAQIPKL